MLFSIEILHILSISKHEGSFAFPAREAEAGGDRGLDAELKARRIFPLRRTRRSASARRAVEYQLRASRWRFCAAPGAAGPSGGGGTGGRGKVGSGAERRFCGKFVNLSAAMTGISSFAGTRTRARKHTHICICICICIYICAYKYIHAYLQA